MIARLLLALLLALGATPVAAMPAGCHDAAMTASPMAHQHRHDHQPTTAEHGCIGCATVADWLAERLASPLPVATAQPLSPAVRFVLGAAGPPRLRPPRIG